MIEVIFISVSSVIFLGGLIDILFFMNPSKRLTKGLGVERFDLDEQQLEMLDRWQNAQMLQKEWGWVQSDEQHVRIHYQYKSFFQPLGLYPLACVVNKDLGVAQLKLPVGLLIGISLPALNGVFLLGKVLLTLSPEISAIVFCLLNLCFPYFIVQLLLSPVRDFYHDILRTPPS